MFHKDDERFATLMTDSFQRQAAIEELTKKRNILGWIASLMAVIMIVSKFFGETINSGMGFITLFLLIAFKFDSDLRLLKVIDKMCAANKLPANDTKGAPKKTPNTELPAGAGLS